MQLALASEVTVALSIAFQFAAGALALRLIPVSGRKAAWTFIALALFGMGIRRSIALARFFSNASATPLDLEYELIGLAVSVCMFLGVLGIRPIFLALTEMTGKLRRSDERYRAFIENTMEGIMVIDPATGAMLDSNPHFRRLTGYGEEELKAMNASAFAPGKEQSVRDNLDAVNAKGRLSFGERAYRRKDGSELYAEVSAVRLEGENGPIAFVVVHDVTERKREAQARERMIAELEEAMTKVKTLSGLLPVCATCKKIRNDQGYWTQMEKYLADHAEVEFTHGICPDCMEKALAELE